MSRAIISAGRGSFSESSFKYSPLRHVRTLFARFVQGLFYGAPPGYYHWEPNESTELIITDENPIQLSEIGSRPAISFTRSPVQFYSLGLDDMMSYSFETGAKKKSVLVPGTMMVNCCSRVDLESETLAWIIAEQLWLHRELLMREGFFEIGRQPVVGAPSKAGSIVVGDSADEWYCTTVACPFQFYRTSQRTPLDQRVIKSIELALRATTRRVRSGQFPNPFTHEVPVAVDFCWPDSFFPEASDVYGATPNLAGEEVQQLPLVPHPLNPAVRVHVRSSRPFGPAVKPPSIGGRVLPISQPCVEESKPLTTATSTHKV